MTGKQNNFMKTIDDFISFFVIVHFADIYNFCNDKIVKKKEKRTD